MRGVTVQKFLRTIFHSLIFFAGLHEARDEARAWVPSSGPQQQWRQDCLARDLQDSLIKAAGDPTGQSQIIQAFFGRCAEHLSRHAPVGVLAQAGVAAHLNAMEYKGYAQFARRDLDVGGGIKMPLIIAAHKGVKRPLVLFQCGLGCKLDGALMFEALIVAFEEGPFHVALLTSTSSDEFQLLNHSFVMGGVYEGMIDHRVAMLLSSEGSPLKDILPPADVDGVHVVGTSLGGHAALYAALDSSESGQGVSSAVGLCPVADFKTAVEELGVHPREPLVGNLFMNKMLSQLKAVYPFVPDLQGLFNPTGSPSPAEIEQVLALASLRFFSRQNLLGRLGHFGGAASENGFWQGHDFKNLTGGIRIPTFLWGAENDYVVSVLSNGARLGGVNPNVNVLQTPLGAHCFFASSFGWDISSALLRGLVEANSPGLLAARRVRSVSLSGVPFNGRFKGGASWEVRLGLEWIVRKSQPFATLRSEIFDTTRVDENDCVTESHCASVGTADIPLALFGKETPRSDLEAEILMHWLNGNVRLSGRRAGVLNHDEIPLTAEWPEYDTPGQTPRPTPPWWLILNESAESTVLATSK